MVSESIYEKLWILLKMEVNSVSDAKVVAEEFLDEEENTRGSEFTSIELSKEGNWIVEAVKFDVVHHLEINSLGAVIAHKKQKS